MNDLSLLIYLADVLPNLMTMLLTIGCISLILSLVMLLYSFLPEFPVSRSTTIFIGVCASIMVLIATLIPSKNAIYLIAGSQAGEMVVMSEDGKEMLADIKTIIKQQIKGGLE